MGAILAEVSLRLYRRPLGDPAPYRAAIQRLHATIEDVSVAAADGASLKAWFVQPEHPNGRSVVILHGVTDNRLGASGFSAMFLNKGYAVLLPDSRAHGLSGGSIATYGVLEREDVHRWAQWLRTRAPGCTYLLGESMGAAIGLQAEPVTPQLCAAAVESPYSTFRAISYERLGRGAHTGALFWRTLGRPIIEFAILYTQLRYGVQLPNANPEAAVMSAATPTLLIAGDKDVDIPMHHAQELERLCASHCALWIVPGAAHGEASLVAHAEFENRVIGWFESHDDAPAP
ncbi:Alpha/beta hydrolase family protein [Granulicella rosea]|uniref:Alpha/beta hydrolase family protein n=1 Tax=Granulicella rosea TaxID=474952 RepID=A0A239CTK5_9BACT|nr:alpha/beta fold hydrolase [Granulicella rosea]SNS23440.1 Alpha/beta hydrolase family protein [Granulicella rosea]